VSNKRDAGINGHDGNISAGKAAGDLNLPHHEALSGDHGRLGGAELLEVMIGDVFAQSIALVSSFGADSAVLIDMVARIDPATPIIFLNTEKLFPETLAYRDTLVELYGLKDVREIRADPAMIEARDADGTLWSTSPDSCCHIRKTLPLDEALGEFRAWITGRKRYQGNTRSDLETIEASQGRIKINPLAHWSKAQVQDYLAASIAPAHPLIAQGYPSIGCAPCTRPVAEGEHERAGRWSGCGKTECGIHEKKFISGW